MKSRPANRADTLRHADPVVQAAADWLVLRDRGFEADEQRDFEAWLGSNERHSAVFAQMEETWRILSQIPDRPVQPEPEDDPCLGRQPGVFRAARRRLLMPLAAAAMITFSALGWHHWNASGRWDQTISTVVGELRTIALPDGSVAQFNTDSAAHVSYNRRERRVTLERGEAHFTVAKNLRRPFIVTAGGVDVRAVGTAFNVHLRATGLEVVVTEGRVAVADAADGRSLLAALAPSRRAKMEMPPALLAVGERAVIPTKTTSEVPSPAKVSPVQSGEIAQMLAWRDRQLQFVSAPLAEIVAEFNRYNRHKLTVNDPRLATQRFGGTFPANDYGSLVQLLRLEFGVIAEEKSDQTILRLPE